jgi:Cys-rich repeat protein
VACLTKSDCGDAGFCVQNACVQCVTDQNCPDQAGTPFCVSNACVQCRTSMDCTGGESCYSGSCY